MRRLGQGAILAIIPGNIIYEFPVIAGFGLEPLASDMFRYRFFANYFQNIITHTGSLIFSYPLQHLANATTQLQS